LKRLTGNAGEVRVTAPNDVESRRPFMRRVVLLSIAVGVLSLVGAAVATAASYVAGSYSGNTSQRSKGHAVAISFNVVKPAHGQAYVTNFSYKTVDSCPNGRRVTISHSQPGHILVDGKGNFTDSHFYPRGGNNHITLRGHLHGSSASGSFVDDNISPPPSCHAAGTWSAHHP
jgi:hypothetical protein